MGLEGVLLAGRVHALGVHDNVKILDLRDVRGVQKRANCWPFSTETKKNYKFCFK